jgi:TetR/AcrR family transcriptional regulator, lmrAB and yxaGH operons repressor
VPRPDRHRPGLLRAAADAVRRRGYAATATSQVLRDAGATNGSLYHHFPGGKAELVRAAVIAAGARIESDLRRAVTGPAGPEAGIDAWLGALIARVENDPLDGCPVAPAAVEAAAVEPTVRHAAAAVFASWTAVLAAALPGPDADDRARAVLSLVEGALLLDRTAGGTTHLVAARRTVRALLATVVRRESVGGPS